MSPRALGLTTAALTLAADQGSKYWMLYVFDVEARAPIRLLPFLDVVMAWNKGISYGNLPLHPMILFAFSIVASLFLGAWMWRAGLAVTSLGLGFIVGGALGNAWDRLAHGAVADFFHFHTPFWLGPLSNYVFNVADVGIVAGAALLLYEAFFVKERAPEAPPAG